MCSGCKACVYICPVNAIIMVKDEEGFEYPEINQEKCIKGSYEDSVDEKSIKLEIESEEDKKLIKNLINEK